MHNDLFIYGHEYCILYYSVLIYRLTAYNGLFQTASSVVPWLSSLHSLLSHLYGEEATPLWGRVQAKATPPDLLPYSTAAVLANCLGSKLSHDHSL